ARPGSSAAPLGPGAGRPLLLPPPAAGQLPDQQDDEDADDDVPDRLPEPLGRVAGLSEQRDPAAHPRRVHPRRPPHSNGTARPPARAGAGPPPAGPRTRPPSGASGWWPGRSGRGRRRRPATRGPRPRLPRSPGPAPPLARPPRLASAGATRRHSAGGQLDGG